MKEISFENRGKGDGKSHCGLIAMKSPEGVREEMEYMVKKSEETGQLNPLTARRLITGQTSLNFIGKPVRSSVDEL